MPIGGMTNYPSLETIANLVRTYVNDDGQGATGTAGEGQILTDSSVTLINLMNSAIREIYRALKISNYMSLIKDNYVLYGVPPMDSTLGLGVPNPAIQTALQFTGYFDGIQNQPNWTLPGDMILPLVVWERSAAETDSPFEQMAQATEPLSASMQTSILEEWEWRTDAIWFHGATEARDLRIRYIATYADVMAPGVNMQTTYVPIMDCQEAVADRISVRYARRLGGDALQDAITQADQSLWYLRCQMSRQRQQIAYQIRSYGDAKAQGGTPAQWLYAPFSMDGLY